MPTKALFLDRDGVINIDTGYVYRPEDFHLVPGIIDLCRAAQEAGYLIVVITNQSGIARSMFSEEDFSKLCLWMRQLFSSQGVRIDAIYHCPVLDDHHPDRKPNPGLFLKATSDLQIDLTSSFSVGDKERDISAALSAGVASNYLLSETPSPTQATARVSSLSELTHLLFPHFLSQTPS
jgi:D,D-heptose 1,7-bisphosphate phosphatase